MKGCFVSRVILTPELQFSPYLSLNHPPIQSSVVYLVLFLSRAGACPRSGCASQAGGGPATVQGEATRTGQASEQEARVSNVIVGSFSSLTLIKLQSVVLDSEQSTLS